MTWLKKGIEKEKSYRSADYEWHRNQIEEAARNNPYPFKKWFPENGRAFFPLGEQSLSLNDDDRDIIEVIHNAGYGIDPDLYVAGYAIDGKQKAKITKILKRIIPELLKQDTDRIENATEKRIDGGYDREVAESEMRNRIWQIETLYNSMIDNFRDSPARSGSGDSLYVVISQDPHDIGRMSTDRNWTSCTNLDSGSNKETVVCEVAAGSLVAYVVRKDDIEIERPLARIHIKRYEDTEGNSYAMPEETSYGADVPEFQESVQKWLDERQGDLPIGTYRRKGGHYSDSLEDSMFVLPKNEEALEQIILNGVENPERFIVWRVRRDDGLDELEPDSDWYEDDYGKYKDFRTEEEAKSWVEHASYDDTWRDYYGGPWLETDEDGEFLHHPYEIEKENLIDEKDVRTEAVDMLINKNGIENLSDEMLKVKKSLLTFPSYVDTFNKQLYFKGKKHLLSDDEVANVEARKDFLRGEAQDIAELPDGEKKDKRIINLTEMVYQNLDWILDSPREAGTEGAYISPMSLVDTHQKTLEALSNKIFNVDKQIPPNLISKMIEVCNSSDSITDKAQISGLKSADLERSLKSATLRTMGYAGADLPEAIRWYESLMPEWKKEWPDKGADSYLKVNIYTLGKAIAALGPDNGQQFLPFLRERAQEAAKLYVSIPDDHINRHDKTKMHSIYQQYMRVISAITPQTQASTWADKYLNAMGMKK